MTAINTNTNARVSPRPGILIVVAASSFDGEVVGSGAGEEVVDGVSADDKVDDSKER